MDYKTSAKMDGVSYSEVYENAADTIARRFGLDDNTTQYASDMLKEKRRLAVPSMRRVQLPVLLNKTLSAPTMEAFSFDGSTGYVEETNPDSSLNIRIQSWTVSAWVQSSYSGTATQEIVSRYACGWDCSSGNGAGYAVWLDGSGRASFEVRDTSGASDVATTGTSNLRDGAWHLVTGVLDRTGAQLSIYVDGALQGSANASALGDVNDSGSPLKIGRFFRQGWASPIAYFSGRIDEVQIYNRALSASEVLGIYNAGSTGVCHN